MQIKLVRYVLEMVFHEKLNGCIVVYVVLSNQKLLRFNGFQGTS